MAAISTDEITTINDLADAYAALDPDATRNDHLTVLQTAAEKLDIPTTLDTPLTDQQAEALDEWWTEAGRC